MTPDQFWNDDPDLLWAYLDAHELKLKEMVIYDNVRAYNQGQYFLLALRDSLQFSKHPKAIYPKKPFPLNEQKQKVTNEDISMIRKQHFIEMAERFKNSRK